MSSVKRPGRPKTNFPKPSDFGIELTFEELGQCLGMSRYSAKVLCFENNVPMIVKGQLNKTVHRAVADLLVSGEWWLEGRAKQEVKEELQDEPVFRPDVHRSAVDARKPGNVYDFDRTAISRRSAAAVGGKA